MRHPAGKDRNQRISLLGIVSVLRTQPQRLPADIVLLDYGVFCRGCKFFPFEFRHKRRAKRPSGEFDSIGTRLREQVVCILFAARLARG